MTYRIILVHHGTPAIDMTQSQVWNECWKVLVFRFGIRDVWACRAVVGRVRQLGGGGEGGGEVTVYVKG